MVGIFSRFSVGRAGHRRSQSALVRSLFFSLILCLFFFFVLIMCLFLHFCSCNWVFPLWLGFCKVRVFEFVVLIAGFGLGVDFFSWCCDWWNGIWSGLGLWIYNQDLWPFDLVFGYYGLLWFGLRYLMLCSEGISEA